MPREYTKKQKERISQNLDLILQEARIRFENQKEVWDNRNKKTFYLLGFVSLFVGFIVVNGLLELFLDPINIFFKWSLLLGLVSLFVAGISLIRIISPIEFGISASVADLRKNMNKNKLFNAKFHLIKSYEKMNQENGKRIKNRANLFTKALYWVLIGLMAIILAKFEPVVKFIINSVC